jgi:hypothetical protein
MIDRTVFANVFTGFADRFGLGKVLSSQTANGYYELLSEHLTTQEFLAASRLIFLTHPYNTWPSPQEFIDAVKPGDPPSLVAGEVFEKILAIDSNIYTPIPERMAAITALGPVALRAYRAAGGRRNFENALEEDVHWLRKDFVEKFEDAALFEVAEERARVALDKVDNRASQFILDVAAKRALPSPHRPR